jgi:dihydroorotate dehydrogenase (NAD+) catalytic subunit
MRQVFHKKVMANVSGFAVDEYVETVRKLDQEDCIGWFEINISCPNVHGGGMSFGTDPKCAYEVTKAVKAVTEKPVIMKLTPNVTDITVIARACEEAGADGISLINTLLGMRMDLKTGKPLLGNITGGYSGPGVFPIAVRMVYQAAHAVKIPVVGLGGIASAEDVLEMMMAGAAAVEVGSANLVDPWACKKIIEDLPACMEKYHIESLEELGK